MEKSIQLHRAEICFSIIFADYIANIWSFPIENNKLQPYFQRKQGKIVDIEVTIVNQ